MDGVKAQKEEMQFFSLNLHHRSQSCCKSLSEMIQEEEEALEHLRHCHVEFAQPHSLI